MRVSTTINENELPDRFRQVFEIAPKEAWRRRAQNLADRERQNPFLTDYLDERYTINTFIDTKLSDVFRYKGEVRGLLRTPCRWK